MISMKFILIFVKIWGFFHFFPKWKGRKYFFLNGNNPVFTVVITVHGRSMPTLNQGKCFFYSSLLQKTKNGQQSPVLDTHS